MRLVLARWLGAIYLCPVCGSAVADVERHGKWHEEQG